MIRGTGKGALQSMRPVSTCWRFSSLLFGATLVLGACAHHPSSTEAAAAEDEINVPPTNYKADILAAMHAYLNDPTGIRDPAIAAPALKPVGGVKRYVVCLRFNAKKNGKDYAGVKEVTAVFIAGRFDRFETTSREACADASYAPFPELGKLAP